MYLSKLLVLWSDFLSSPNQWQEEWLVQYLWEKGKLPIKKTVASSPCGEKETLIKNLIRFSEYFEPNSNSLLYNTFIQVGVVMKGLLSKMMTDILTVYLWAEVNSRIICIRWCFCSDSRKDNFLLILILTLLKEPSPWSFYCQFLHFSQYQPLILYCKISAKINLTYFNQSQQILKYIYVFS